MSVKHELPALDSVSRDWELKSNSNPPLFSPPSIGLPTWPTNALLFGPEQVFSQDKSPDTHWSLGFIYWLLLLLLPRECSYSLLTTLGFLLMHPPRLFRSSAHFLSLPSGLDCCHLNKQWVCWITSATRTVVLPKLTTDESLFICDLFSFLPNKEQFLLSCCRWIALTLKTHTFRNLLNDIMALLTW